MNQREVVIVCADRAAAAWQCRVVGSFAGVRAAGVATTATMAESLIASLRPDLVLLDLDIGVDGGEGLVLLRRIRARPAVVEVVVSATAPSTAVVRYVLQLGVLDVVLKPVATARLHKSLGVFARHMSMLATPALAQEQLDRLCSNGPNAQRWIPRDLASTRLEEVRGVLATADVAITAVLVAQRVGIAPVTARRYLDYLVTTGEAAAGRSVGGLGRPPNTYRAADHYRRVVA